MTAKDTTNEHRPNKSGYGYSRRVSTDVQVSGESLKWHTTEYFAYQGGQMAKVDSPPAVSATFGFRWREGKFETGSISSVRLGRRTTEIGGAAADARTALTL